LRATSKMKPQTHILHGGQSAARARTNERRAMPHNVVGTANVKAPLALTSRGSPHCRLYTYFCKMKRFVQFHSRSVVEQRLTRLRTHLSELVTAWLPSERAPPNMTIIMGVTHLIIVSAKKIHFALLSVHCSTPSETERLDIHFRDRHASHRAA
jgi:hypothetical protein